MVEPFSILALIIGSSVLSLVLGTTWAIILPLLLSTAPQTGILSFQFLPWVFGAFLFQCRLRFEPPIKASSISTEPFSITLNIERLAICRKRCNKYQAVG